MKACLLDSSFLIDLYNGTPTVGRVRRLTGFARTRRSFGLALSRPKGVSTIVSRVRSLGYPAVVNLRLVTVAVVATLGGGCAIQSNSLQITMDVRARIDPEWKSDIFGASFVMIPALEGTPDELLEKELLHYVSGRLQAKGLMPGTAGARFMVGISAFIGPKEEYVPPTTFYWPIPSSSTTETTTNTGLTLSSTTHGSQYVPIHRPGYTLVHYFRSITIFLGLPKSDGSGVTPVWQGTAESTGDLSDLLEVAPTLIRNILTEFPRRSGYPSRRTADLIGANDP